LFTPSLIWKLVFRGGRKKNFSERFGFFSREKKEQLKNFGGDVWVHSVSVGETQAALSMIKAWGLKNPQRRFVLSTTTTTAQELAYRNLPPNTALIFCPLDFMIIVRSAIRLIRPRLLVILETEIWPNMICETRRVGAEVALVNARISDRSRRGYERFAFFFGKVLSNIHVICVQSEIDSQRFLQISQKLPVHVCGNMKFDQSIDESNTSGINLDDFFGPDERLVIIAASTHPGEEEFIGRAFIKLKDRCPSAKLIIVPRHAERGIFISAELKKMGIPFVRRSEGKKPSSPVQCLLADTTGEMLKFIAASDIVIMGKSLAGHKEGHNLIEPALLGKPIITGGVLTNFRFILQVLLQEEGLITVFDFEQLCSALEKLASIPDLRKKIGENAKRSVKKHRGAIEKTINLLEQLVSD
ncbi:MAG TPA: 3-deoxy-D-manno-octulosonic acid transferase, partial [Victivallales bacterium]|nr:3-deoxy-D-manno-octulosonic acid transferase [Victivallales bacterium]